jgi:GxxExxY protein
MDTQITEVAIGAAMEVANTLGGGFLEKVYERALAIELRSRGLRAETQVSLPVLYKGHLVGDYAPDLLVNGQLILELKCADRLGADHLAQCLNYLKAAGLRTALLLNFQRSKLEWKRVSL